MLIGKTPRRIRSSFLLPAVMVLTAAVLLVLAVGPYMHECDQASIIKGTVELITGHMESARKAYNFDKQFVSYGLLAATFQLLPKPFSADQVTLASNLVCFAFFWATFIGYVARFGRRVSAAFLVPIIFAPALLLHSPFFGTAMIGASFLFLIPFFLELKAAGLLRSAAIFLAMFCAVGARADSVFAVPLLGLIYAKGRSVKMVLRSKELWIMAAAAAAAVLLGWHMHVGLKHALLPPFFKLKVLVGFAVFGLGAVIFLFPACLLALLACALQLKARRLKILLLAAVLAAPLLFYGGQLASTRYFVLPIVCLLLLICSRPGAAILELFLRNRLAAVLKMVLLAASILPLFIGIDVAFLHRPKLTWSHVTQFPTDDGVMPMGAYLRYFLRLKTAHGLIDHNQAVWLAAQHVRYRAGDDKEVAVLRTPVSDFLLLAARLQGNDTRYYGCAGAQSLPRFYTDSRTLMRDTITHNPYKEPFSSFLTNRSLIQVSSLDLEGITVFECSLPRTNQARNDMIWVLNSELGGNEYRVKDEFVLEASNTNCSYQVEEEHAGKTLALVGTDKFRCVMHSPGEQPASCEAHEVSDADGHTWFVVQINGLVPKTKIVLTTADRSKICRVITVLPDWMSVGSFASMFDPLAPLRKK